MTHSVDVRVRALVALRECGTYAGAAREAGVSAGSVRRWAAGASLPGATRKAPVSLPYEEKVAIVRRLCLGERAEALAAEAGVTPAAVYGWRATLRRRGALALMGDREVAARVRAEGAAGAAAEELAARNAELELRVAVLEAKLEILKKDPGADPSSLTSRERAALVDSLRARFPLGALLAEAGIARSTYYRARAAASRPDPIGWLKPLVAAAFDESGGTYGSGRVWARLRELGVRVSEKVVRRAMRELGLVARSSSRAPARWSSYEPGLPGAAPNLLLADEARDLHDFSASRPGERLVTDITEFRLGERGPKCYLSAMVDLFDGRVVAWRAGASPSAELATGTLEDALEAAGGPFLAHSDRGMHYRTRSWLAACRSAGVTRSMSRKGHSPDNAAMEGFFGRLKVEMFEGRDWSGWTPDAFAGELAAYVRWYNSGRLKAFRDGDGRVRHETIDGRRRRLGLAA